MKNSKPIVSLHTLFRKTRVCTLLFLICFIAMLACGCDFLKDDETLILERLATFENAYNSGDWEATLNCFDSKTRNTYKAMFSVGEKIGNAFIGFDISFSDLFALGMAIVPESGQLSIDIDEIVIDRDNTAVANVESRFNQEQVISQIWLVKEGHNWYIQNVD